MYSIAYNNFIGNTYMPPLKFDLHRLNIGLATGLHNIYRVYGIYYVTAGHNVILVLLVQHQNRHIPGIWYSNFSDSIIISGTYAVYCNIPSVICTGIVYPVAFCAT